LLFLLSYFGEIQKTVDDDMCLYFLNIDKPCRSGADSWSSVYELRAEESICCVKSDVYVPNNERNQKSTSVSTLLRVRRLRRHGRTVLWRACLMRICFFYFSLFLIKIWEMNLVKTYFQNLVFSRISPIDTTYKVITSCALAWLRS
jgi:hypothetical protein